MYEMSERLNRLKGNLYAFDFSIASFQNRQTKALWKDRVLNAW